MDFLSEYGAEEGDDDHHKVPENSWTAALARPTLTNAFLNMIVLRSEDPTVSAFLHLSLYPDRI